jgi:hypothetical protein
MITGYSVAERNRLERLTRQLGGAILQDLPEPTAAAAAAGSAAPSPLALRQKPGSSSSSGCRLLFSASSGSSSRRRLPVHALIADVEGKTAKFLYAAAAGLPVCTAAWVTACAEQGRLLDPAAAAGLQQQSSRRPQQQQQQQHLLRPGNEALVLNPSCRLLAGLRVLLYGEEEWQAVFEGVVGHAGALVLQQLEAAVSTAGATAAAAGSEVTEAAVDLVIANTAAAAGSAVDAAGRRGSGAAEAAAAEKAKQDLHALRRAARRLRVPVVDADTVVASIMAGSWPEKLQQVLLGRQQQQQESADAAMRQDQQQQQPGGKKKHKSAAAAAGAAARQQQQQDVQASPAVAAAAGSSKRARLSTPQPSLQLHMPPASPKLQQQQQQPLRSPQQQQQQQVVPPAAGTLQVVGFSWLTNTSSAAAAAAAASPRSAAGLRTYQQGFTLQLRPQQQQGPNAAAAIIHREVRCGDFVLLSPATGEAAPRVVQLAALWQEVPSDGRVRMLARGRRFYR